MSREEERELVAATLRDRLREADREITPPPGLWERVLASPEPTRRSWRPSRRVVRLASATAAVLGIGAVTFGVWRLQHAHDGVPITKPAATLTVYNAEQACEPLRTMECALGLARDPHAVYNSRGNEAGLVWHGDILAATCVVTNGTAVRDEAGVTSQRWYLVTTSTGAHGWLPGVRTRNSAIIRTCTPAESSER